MDRRDFTKKTLLTGCSLLTGSMLISSCTTTKSIQSQISENNTIQIKLAELSERNLLIVKIPELESSILLIKNNDEWKAVHMECTHIQCELALKKDLLVCPCHGSTFTTTGKVLTGPAHLDLPQLPTRLTDHFLEITFE